VISRSALDKSRATEAASERPPSGFMWRYRSSR
jgi:hypothetical protein